MGIINWEYEMSVYAMGKQWGLNCDGEYFRYSMGCVEKTDAESIKSASDYKERFFTFANRHINNQPDADLIACLCENEKHKFECWYIELLNLSRMARVRVIKDWFDLFVDGKTPSQALKIKYGV